MQLDPKSTALVLIDLQKGVLALSVAPHPATEVYAGSLRLVERFHAAKAPVVWVRVSFSSDLADAPLLPVDQPTNYAALPPGWDEFPGPLHPSDLTVTKRQWGAFYGTDLDMNATFQNSAQVLSIGIFFSLMIAGLATTLSITLKQGLMQHGVSATVADHVGSLPPVSVLFAAFLGYNPIRTLLGPGVLAHLSAANRAALTGHSFFPQLISGPFRAGLIAAFTFAMAACLIAAAASWSRGSRYVHDD